MATTTGAWLIAADGTEVLRHFTTQNSPLLSNEVNCIGILPKTGEVFFGGKQPNAADVAIFSTLNLVEKAGVKLPQWSHLSVVYEKVATVGTIPEYIAQNLSAYVTME